MELSSGVWLTLKILDQIFILPLELQKNSVTNLLSELYFYILGIPVSLVAYEILVFK